MLTRPKVLAFLLVALLVAAAGCGGQPKAAPADAPAPKPAGPPPAAADAVWIAKDPTDIPAPITRREPANVVVELEAREVTGQLKENISYDYWTFGGTLPGPMIRARVGDTVEIRLHNKEGNVNTHSIDLHAVNGPGGGGEVSQVNPGETRVFRFKALNPGVFVYHCATPFIAAHIAQGMYGMILIEPEEGWGEVDHEFYLMQGEVYANIVPSGKGHAAYDGAAVTDENPNFVVFNGAFQAITGEHEMKAKVGDKIRMFVGNGGPNLISSFHIIGEIFDVVYVEGGALTNHNIQTTLIPAAGATMVEFTVDVPGTYVLLDHSISRALTKGALATLTVTGPEVPEIFEPLT